ncbi:alphavirus core family protein [Perilla frutescens var. hirtella]|nr:alphavirus core family protein [Perilla frutescens var. hirtella]KAH6817210.1 alphavirus core family protein [Perilla frutescens var. frutescens]
MAAMAQLRFTPLAGHYSRPSGGREFTSFAPTFADNTSASSVSFPSLKYGGNLMRQLDLQTKFQLPCAGGGGDIGVGRGSGGGDGGKGGWSGGGDSDESKSSWDGFGPIGAFVHGWRSRVAADPQFPFKVLMEELVGVSACVLGDMASRPNFGLNELDFVFSTLVVGSIMNFVLMYLLAPSMSSASLTLPGIFASSPTSHMFEPGAYSVLSRFGTFVYKGTVFAAVGFAAGLVGTALSNGLIKMRKKMDPSFETPNKAPPTVLNAITWAIHMGVSSNFRYQTLNGIEYVLAKGLSPVLFKTSVVVLRCLNNILGGMSFVVLARLTGSQSVEGGKGSTTEERDKLVSEAESDDFLDRESTSK